MTDGMVSLSAQELLGVLGVLEVYGVFGVLGLLGVFGCSGYKRYKWLLTRRIPRIPRIYTYIGFPTNWFFPKKMNLPQNSTPHHMASSLYLLHSSLKMLRILFFQQNLTRIPLEFGYPNRIMHHNIHLPLDWNQNSIHKLKQNSTRIQFS